MNKKIFAIAVLIMTLVVSNAFASANVIKSETKSDKNTLNNGGLISLDDKEEIYIYGKDFDNIVGDWEYYGDRAIRLSPGNGGCTVYYVLDIGYNEIEEDSLEIGIYFCDWAWWPLADGPDLFIGAEYYDPVHFIVYYLVEEGCGDQDDPTWKWYTIDYIDDFVNDKGQVFIKLYCDNLDDTILDTVGVKFIPIIPEPDLNAWIDEPLSWSEVKPGDTRTGTIYVENIGEPDSKLDWEASESLDWVSCSPTDGQNLLPGTTKPITITVEASENEEETRSGTITVKNSESPDDKLTFDVDITTEKKSRNRPLFFALFERFPLLERLLPLVTRLLER